VRKEPIETLAPSKDPNKKAPMPMEQQEREAEEDALQHALHLSRVEANRTRPAGSRHALRIGVEKEAAGQPLSWSVGLTTRLADGSKTHFPHPVAPPSLSRTRSPTTLPPHLAKRMEVARRNLPRPLVSCRSVPLEPRKEGWTSQRARSDPPGAPRETPTGVGASRTLTTVTTTTTTRRENSSTLKTGSSGLERGEGPAPFFKTAPLLLRSDPLVALGGTRTVAGTP